VLLYAITVGELPFEDDVVQRILQKIAFTEPTYPTFLSPQLIDLLKKILVKSPDERITISKIKRHPWLSQGAYSQLFSVPLSHDEKFSMKGVERELIDYIARLGVDVRLLPRQILEGEYNETTALYVILRREMSTERLKELMQRLSGAVQSPGIPKVQSANGIAPMSPRAAGIPKPAARAKIRVPQFGRHTGGLTPRAPMPVIQPVSATPMPTRRVSAADETDQMSTPEALRDSPRQLHKVLLPLKRPRSHNLK
jgi:hypothetical protein